MKYAQWNGRVLKLSETRVWRTYTGGAEIDRWRGKDECITGSFPEDWVASTTRARNPGREDMVEGYSRVLNIPGQPYLKEVLEDQPENYFGSSHLAKIGPKPGVLIKLIDAHERLTIQTHPDRQYAKDVFHSNYGKTESWYILGTHAVNGEQPCVYFGFKPGITRERWKEVFEAQDIPAMLDCLHRIPVQAGDSFFIPGGLPHAIGAGCFLAEVQEPTDYTMRTELVTPGGLHIKEEQCHQGVGYEKMLDCFHYEGESMEQTCAKWRSSPRIMHQENGVEVASLIDDRFTQLFQMNRIRVSGQWSVPQASTFRIWVVVKGEGVLHTPKDEVSLQQSDFLLLPASLPQSLMQCTGKELELIECVPPLGNVCEE